MRFSGSLKRLGVLSDNIRPAVCLSSNVETSNSVQLQVHTRKVENRNVRTR